MKNQYVLLSRSLGIPNFQTFDDFAKAIGLSKRLLFLLTTETERFYSKREIPKRNGGIRLLHCPSYTLKTTQKWVLRNILDKVAPSPYAVAFRKKKEDSQAVGIKSNAQYHANALYGLSIDLSDFFPSIHANQVFQVFRSIGYSNTACTILTRLCTLDDKLPQGAVCSPALSNLVCISMDNRLFGLCSKRGVFYTRYADDMYFSCDDKGLLKKLFPIIKKIIEEQGFRINEEKFHYQTPKGKKLITGVLVAKNKDAIELKAQKALKRKIRAEIFRCVMSGNYENAAHIKGEIEFVSYIQGGNRQDYKSSIIAYLDRTAKKIVRFPELVNEYNSHLFYKNDQHLVKSLPVSEERVENDEEAEVLFAELEYAYSERKAYLDKHQLHDICKYEGWPDFEKSEEHDENSDDAPF